MSTYGRGRLRPTTPDEKQPRPDRRGQKQVGCGVPIRLYAQLDAECRRSDVSFAHAIRQGLKMWLAVQQRRNGEVVR